MTDETLVDLKLLLLATDFDSDQDIVEFASSR